MRIPKKKKKNKLSKRIKVEFLNFLIFKFFSKYSVLDTQINICFIILKSFFSSSMVDIIVFFITLYSRYVMFLLYNIGYPKSALKSLKSCVGGAIKILKTEVTFVWYVTINYIAQWSRSSHDITFGLRLLYCCQIVRFLTFFVTIDLLE